MMKLDSVFFVFWNFRSGEINPNIDSIDTHTLVADSLHHVQYVLLFK